MDRTHDKYDRLIQKAKALAPLVTAVAYPCDESSLAGTIDAARMGLIKPVLVGPAARIKSVAEKCGIDLSGFEVMDVSDSHAAAARPSRSCVRGEPRR